MAADAGKHILLEKPMGLTSTDGEVNAPTADQVETVDGANHWLMAERARELMWEGHRRTDLVRYGLYTGDAYLWTYKGGSPQGQAFADHMYIFPIPASEMASNPMLVQNEGYL